MRRLPPCTAASAFYSQPLFTDGAHHAHSQPCWEREVMRTYDHLTPGALLPPLCYDRSHALFLLSISPDLVSSPITSWKIDGETVADYFGGAPKSLQMVIAVMKLKDTYSLEGKL